MDRDKTWNWFTDDFMTRHSKDSALLIIATRWHIDDLIGRMKNKWPDMNVLEFPAIAEKDEGWRKIGKPLFPEHKPLDFLLERKALMSPASWSAEYQQHPVLLGDSTFPVENLRIVQVFQRAEIASSVPSVDKAGTAGGDGAYTAIVLMHKMKNGTFVIERVVRGRWGALDRETLIKRMAEDVRNDLSPLGVGLKIVIEQEPGSGGKESAEATIRNLAGFNCVADKPGAGRSKEVRAEPLACQVQVILNGAVEATQLKPVGATGIGLLTAAGALIPRPIRRPHISSSTSRSSSASISARAACTVLECLCEDHLINGIITNQDGKLPVDGSPRR